MKKKGAVLSIICLTLVLLNIVPLFSYAGNGQCSFWVGNGNSFDTEKRGFVNPKLYVNDQEGLTFDLSFYESIVCNLYLVSVYKDESFAVFSPRLYVNHVHEVDLLNSPFGYSNGHHTIDIAELKLNSGGYKLIAIVNEDDIINCTIYEYYFVYTGFSNNIIGNGADLIDSYYTIREYEDGTLVETPVLSAPYNNIMSYTGTLTPLTSGAQRVRISVSLGQYSASTKFNPEYFDIWFKELTFNVTNNDGSRTTCNYCSVYLYNATKRKNTFIGVINNITRSTSTSSLMSYPIYFDNDLVSNGDILQIDLYFYVQVDTLHVGTQFDYNVTCNKISFTSYRDSSASDVYNSIDDLKNAGDSLSNVERPNINFDDLDINDIIGTDSINSASAYFESLYSFEIIGIMLMVVAILVLLSYLFFGKK